MRARDRIAVTAVSLMLAVLAGCSTTSSPSVRPYPVGDPSGLSRAPNASASLRPAADRTTMRPGQVFVPAVGINARVIDVGTRTEPDPFLAGKRVSSFEVPPDLARVGWWTDGAIPGGPGMAILLGHSQVGGGFAVFNRIGELRRGDTVTLEDAEGDVALRYAVTDVVPGISKYDESALQTVLAGHSATSDLALVTCSGDFDDVTVESEANTVVFAARQ